MIEAIARFVIGGVFVSVFAILGDILRPKSFAGLFGAAPSVAIATLLLTIHQQGASYAAVEAHSMIGGAIAFCAYAGCVCWVVMRYKCSASIVAGLLLIVWLVTAMSLRVIWLR
jgi:hypothetical protein